MPSPLLAKAAPQGREIVNVTPERAGWTHVGFRAVRLKTGETETVQTGTRERAHARAYPVPDLPPATPVTLDVLANDRVLLHLSAFFERQRTRL